MTHPSPYERFMPVPKSSEVPFEVKKPTEVKGSTKAKATKKTTSHPFTLLPAELRAKIWAIALHDQTEQVSLSASKTGNAVDIHQHTASGEISVRSTRGYPTLFFVNREARYEAAKIDGGAWYSLGVGAPEVYLNFDKELVTLHKCCKASMIDGNPLRQKAGIVTCDVQRKKERERIWRLFTSSWS